ncbi:hypothetical protein LY76DRAFT_339947 [Colletotrichum caudatum]|nr:hypothetical protein LY76DRAFT_339947 [Colletotrichum caudatum]
MNYIQPPGDMSKASCPSPPRPPLPSMRTSLLLEVMPRPRPSPRGRCRTDDWRLRRRGKKSPYRWVSGVLLACLSTSSFSFLVPPPPPAPPFYVPRSGPPLWTPFVIRKRPLTLYLLNLRVVPLSHIHARARTRTHTRIEKI